MPKFFDIDELGKSKPTASGRDRQAALQLGFEESHYEKITNIKKLLGEAPTPGVVYFLWTLNSFNAFTFIVYTIKHFGVIGELILSTYNINERILSSMIRWYDAEQIRNIDICISDSFRSRVPKVNDQLTAYARSRRINIHYAWNHSKIILMRTAEHFFVVAGSGNFSENALNEQYIFIDDERAYRFYADCIRNSAN